jgi:hypothetical protein
MDVRARLAAVAFAYLACGAHAAPDLSHLIDLGPISPAGTELIECHNFLFCATTVDVKTEDWHDRTPARALHKDGCTVYWKYGGFDVRVSKYTGTKLRWKINRLDKETYYFDRSIGIKLEDDDKNDRYWDLDQEGHDFGRDTFKWYDFNRRPRLEKSTEPDPTKRAIRFDFRIFRERGANGKPGPELCGSVDPLIFNRG